MSLIKKISNYFVISCLSVSSFAIALRDYDQSPRNISHLSSVISKYDKDILISLIRSFVKETRPTRVVGSEGHYKASQFIFDYIKKNTQSQKSIVFFEDFDPDIDDAIKMYKDDLSTVMTGGANVNKAELKRWQQFTNSRVAHLEKLRNIKGRNIIWEKKGSVNPEQIIVVGAHYDTMAYDKKTLEIKPLIAQPGADNNASGVSVALAMIEMLSELNIKKTVRVVFFDYQELGFLGSLDYAKKLSQEMKTNKNILGFINLLMLGHDSKLADKSKSYGNMSVYYSSVADDTVSTASEEKVLIDQFLASGKSIAPNVSFKAISQTFKNGDSVSFNKFQIPAITFTQNWEDDFNSERIHTSSDFVETLNFKTFHESFRYIAGAVSAWALGL